MLIGHGCDRCIGCEMFSLKNRPMIVRAGGLVDAYLARTLLHMREEVLLVRVRWYQLIADGTVACLVTVHASMMQLQFR